MPTIQLHGPPAIAHDDGRSVVLSAREAALLAWLHLEGPTPRARIAARLWPGGDDAKARANLRQTLRRLKQAAGELLQEADQTLALAPQVAVAQASDARLLGPLEFDDAPELAEWLQSRRDAEARARLRERLAAAREHLARGELDAALAAADAVLADDNAVEEAHRLRMETFYQRGDRAAAVAAWDECRHALRATFGITPSTATNELGRLILQAEAAGQIGAVRALPAALRRPPQLIARAGVMDLLARSFALGHGAVVAGPGGIGKSRVIAEAAAAMQPAIVVGARPGDVLLPGVLASRLVAAAIGRFNPDLDGVTRADIARLLPGGGELKSALEHRRVLASVARTMLACHAKGMRLVAVDDLQFADDLSMEAIAVVIGGWLAEPPESAALPLFGCRADELRPSAAALVQMMDRSGRSARIDLAPLGAEDLARLIASLPLGESLDPGALARTLHAQVGGNPAFVLESLRALWQQGLPGWQAGTALPVPATLVESVKQRLQRLSPDALRLAQLAAVAEGDFSLDLAAQAFGRAPLELAPAFAELDAAQVLQGTGFSHDLVAQAVEQSVPTAMRAPLHRLVAEHLIARQGAASRVAAHLQAAGDARAAAPWHLKAAEQARQRWRLAESAEAYEAALAALDPVAERARALQCALHAARQWLWLSRPVDAARALDAAEPLVRDAAERCRAAALRIIWMVNRREEAAAIERARALAAELLDAAPQLSAEDINRALRAVAVALPMAGAGEQALALVQTLAPRIDLTDPALAADFRLLRGALLCRLDRPQHAREDLQAAFEIAAALGNDAVRMSAGSELMRALSTLGRAREAYAVAEATLAAIQDRGFGAGFEADQRGVMAVMLIALGRPGDAMRELETSLALLERAGRPLPDFLRSNHALARVMLGQLDEAEALLDAAEPLPEEGYSLPAQMHARARSRLAQARGDDGRPWLEHAAHHGARGLAHELMMAIDHAPVTCAIASDWLDEAVARERAAEARWARLQASHAALAEGEREAATALLRDAVAAEDAVDPWLDDPTRPWCDGSRGLRDCGCPDEADAVLERGRRWLHAAARTLPEGPLRDAWLNGHALHRLLR